MGKETLSSEELNRLAREKFDRIRAARGVALNSAKEIKKTKKLKGDNHSKGRSKVF